MPITYEWVKLYGRILDSSIMEYSVPARLFFHHAIVASDSTGRLFGTTATLARRFNMPEAAVIKSLEELAKPDLGSKNKDHDGARLIQVGEQEYLVVSKKDYNPDPTNAERQKRFRNARNASNAEVTEDNARGEESREEESREEKRRGRESMRFAPPSLEEILEYGKEIPGLDAEAFFDFYASKGWKVGVSPMKDWRAAARKWRRKDIEDGKVKSTKKASETYDREAEVAAELAEERRQWQERHR